MRSADLSRSFLSKQNRVYPAVQARREKWCAAGLHQTVCMRVLVALPLGDDPPYLEKKMADPDATQQEMPAEHDVVVQLDRTNVHLLLAQCWPRKTPPRITTCTSCSPWQRAPRWGDGDEHEILMRVALGGGKSAVRVRLLLCGLLFP